MKLLDLFSGIGGFSLGAEYNNIETIGFVEKDAFCQKVLRKHWPNTPIIGNIRDVTKDTFKSVDIVSGGFPCQPFSVAGKRRGTDDDRYLWDETIRVVSLYKPRWFVGENVEGIVNIQNGMVLRQVQDDLEKEGFEVQCGIIPASGIGAWHQRKRVWILGYSQHNGSSTSKKRGGNTQTSTGPQKRENPSLQSERTSRPTDNGNVSNTNSSLRRGRATVSQGGENKIWGFHSRKKNKTNQTYGAKLSDAMLYLEKKKMYPTPVAKDNCSESLETWERRAKKHKAQGKTIPKALRIQVQEESKKIYNTPTTNDGKNTSFPKSQRNRTSIVGNLMQEKNPLKVGGRLNPQFVQFLMGYPMNWTKIE